LRYLGSRLRESHTGFGPLRLPSDVNTEGKIQLTARFMHRIP
jgi:hypothetical protein